jgi:hypothetical protein
MGATAKPTSNKNFYKVENFNFCKSVNVATENSKEVEYNGKKYFREYYSQLNGKLTNIWRNTQTNKDESKEWEEISFQLQDSENNIEVLTFYFGSRESESILNRLLNADLTKELVFTIFKDSEKERAVILLQQEDNGKNVTIPNHFTKDKTESESFGTYPALEQKKVKGKLVYDNSERCEFWDKIISLINATIKGND